MRAPVRFVVLRHLLTHPDEGPAEIARHTHTWTGSVAQALKRIRAPGRPHERELLVDLREVSERPPREETPLYLPNPANWFRAFQGRWWLSGEDAAARDGYSLIPERHLVYVRKEDREAALRAALQEAGKLASKGQANLTIRVADPWLHLPPDEDLVERGQRLLDYLDSRHVQLARGLTQPG